jgi:hypothetical protein
MKKLPLSPRHFKGSLIKNPSSPKMIQRHPFGASSVLSSMSPKLKKPKKGPSSIQSPDSRKVSLTLSKDVQTSDDDSSFGQVLYPSSKLLSLKKSLQFKLEVKSSKCFDSKAIPSLHDSSLQKEHLSRYFKTQKKLGQNKQ